MKWRKWLEQWEMTSLKIRAPFLEMNWEPADEDRNAAWELYVELLTRITTQPLDPEYGDEKTTLESVHQLFGLTRDVIKRNGRHCREFTKLAIVILNQIVRPFTAKWHRRSLAGGFDDPAERKKFRGELAEIQTKLRTYTRMLAEMAGVEDLTELEE